MGKLNRPTKTVKGPYIKSPSFQGLVKFFTGVLRCPKRVKVIRKLKRKNK